MADRVDAAVVQEELLCVAAPGQVDVEVDLRAFLVRYQWFHVQEEQLAHWHRLVFQIHGSPGFQVVLYKRVQAPVGVHSVVSIDHHMFA